MGNNQPFKSLNAVTANGNGGSLDVGGTCNQFSLYVVTTGTPSGYTVDLQVSPDGTNWFTHGGVQVTNAVTAGYDAVASGDVPHARYARAKLSGLTGGTAPTVTAWIVPGEVV